VYYVQKQNDKRSRRPSAVQFRMGGCKGVLAVDPKLGDGDKLVIRPSMEKFQCNEHKLEVIVFSKPRETVILFVVVTVNLYSAFFVKEPQTRCVC